MWRHLILLTACVPILICVRIINPGPKYPPTKGEVWPKPQHEVKELNYYVIEPRLYLNVTTPQHTCDILNKGIERHLLLNLKAKFRNLKIRNSEKMTTLNDSLFKGILDRSFCIELTSECEKYPHFDMDESYNLTVGQKNVLTSASIWGILRGLETFTQLFYYNDDYTSIFINATSIVDYPAYKYRGLLIDTGRHYLHEDTIHAIINAIAMNKMNVLHWHIVDDQSFPFQSEKFPSLSEKGAYFPSIVYTKSVIQQIVEHGRLLGVRVIPEFDVPGHVRSWGTAFPDLLTKCYKEGEFVGLGPLNPIKNDTYTFLQQLYEEVKELFPDEYLHLGGDEVDLSCWKSNPKINKYMEDRNLTTGQLHAEFMGKVKLLLPQQVKPIVWQEVFDETVPLPNKTLIQVWKYKWIAEMDNILKAGHRVIFSSSWYLDYLNFGWESFYKDDPRLMVYTARNNPEGLDDIVGGEACMWGEMADDNNILSRTWPRASAVAERLWTGVDYEDPQNLVTDYVRRRIEEHTCRMIMRGVPAEPPNGPGFCVDTVH